MQVDEISILDILYQIVAKQFNLELVCKAGHNHLVSNVLQTSFPADLPTHSQRGATQASILLYAGLLNRKRLLDSSMSIDTSNVLFHYSFSCNKLVAVLLVMSWLQFYLDLVITVFL